MSIQDDKKNLDAAGAEIPADTYGNRAERIAEAEDQDATKADEPGTGSRVVSAMNPGDEERQVSDEPPERNISPHE